MEELNSDGRCAQEKTWLTPIATSSGDVVWLKDLDVAAKLDLDRVWAMTFYSLVVGRTRSEGGNITLVPKEVCVVPFSDCSGATVWRGSIDMEEPGRRRRRRPDIDTGAVARRHDNVDSANAQAEGHGDSLADPDEGRVDPPVALPAGSEDSSAVPSDESDEQLEDMVAALDEALGLIGGDGFVPAAAGAEHTTSGSSGDEGADEGPDFNPEVSAGTGSNSSRSSSSSSSSSLSARLEDGEESDCISDVTALSPAYTDDEQEQPQPALAPRLIGRGSPLESWQTVHGLIKFVAAAENLVAHCANPAHGLCRCTRTVNSSEKRPSQGRPVGFLLAWLAAGDQFHSRAEHVAACRPSLEERRAARNFARQSVQGAASLFEKERAKHEDEASEPE